MNDERKALGRGGYRRKNLKNGRIEACDITKLLVRLVTARALEIRTLMDDTYLVQEFAALRDENRVADVIGRLDVVAKRFVKLLDSLTDGFKRHSAQPLLNQRATAYLS